ncbi:MAG: hypothetical protein QM758_22975 [Armatimonas sp.]
MQEPLPVGNAPAPVALPHFPDVLHAVIWRNWTLVPQARLAKVVGASPAQIRALGKSMGLPDPQRISTDQWRRSALTIIRRNWHLLPYEQLLALLDWTPEKLAFTLREDDFLYVKLGNHKPHCPEVRWKTPDAAARQRAAQIAEAIRGALPEKREPLFTFVRELEKPPKEKRKQAPNPLSPRFCYSYFALYGDPLLEKHADPYPDGYLARLAASGVDGVWLQAVLSQLAPNPWNPAASAQAAERLAGLHALVKRAKRHGIGVWLYSNEPRALPLSVFANHPELKGVTEGDHATLCTARPEVRAYLTEATAAVCRAVPELAGFFTITYSENLTHCWSHGRGADCPRCASRGAAASILDVNGAIYEGITRAGGHQRLIAWDWAWPDSVATPVIEKLPAETLFMSVSEWDLPIRRGGVAATVGEYSLSAIGPGPRATRHWALARARGLKTVAKIQAANSWELSAVPYVPAVENSATHAARLREAGVDGLMLGWTLGGYPSPNLEAVAEIGQGATVEQALQRVALRRYGASEAPGVVAAWKTVSAAYQEFPFHISTVYQAPLQTGPANLLWETPTGYTATMVGFGYDDLDSWRSVYPPEVFIAQLRKVAEGFLRGAALLERSTHPGVRREAQLIEATALHFASVANQARFVQLRGRPSRERTALLTDEARIARRLLALQSEDSRIGFEASNQYYYVEVDLLEKLVNIAYLQSESPISTNRK